jgi:hypothetical protein
LRQASAGGHFRHVAKEGGCSEDYQVYFVHR